MVIVGLASLIITSWLLFTLFVVRILKKPQERQQSVLKKMISFEFLFPRMPWIKNPEIETDPERKRRKKEKLYQGARYMAVNMLITSILALLIGFIFIRSDFFALEIFSLITAPAFGFCATYYFSIWYLMKKLDYANSNW
jgi:hypothetical protein